MKRIILFTFILIAAVAFSSLLIDQKGYILIAMGEYTIESSVVFAIIFLLVSFIALTILLKAFKGGLNVSLGAWHKVRYASQRRAYRNLEKGIASFVLGDLKQAEHLLVKSAEPTEFTQTAYLMAASAADQQGLKDNTKHYLHQLEQQKLDLKQNGLESVLITLRLLLNNHEFKNARELIDQHHKFIGHDHRLLAIEIELALKEHRFYYVVEQLNSARKQKAFSEAQITAWEQEAFSGAFDQKLTEHDQQALNDYWNSLNRKVKSRDEVVMAYCQVLAQHKVHQPLSKILLPLINKGTNEVQLKRMRHLPLTQVNELIDATQKHLHKEQKSEKWLRMLAHLACMAKQWDKAEKAFNALLHIEGNNADKLDLMTFAYVLEQLNKQDQAISALRKAALMA